MLCLGQLMMVLDATIVNVALPSIQRDLHFTQSNLTWVINGYLITFGGLLLLAGQDGRPRRPQESLPRRAGESSRLASIACGLAPSQGALIGARLVQGVGGAIASSVILAIIVTEFPGRVEQAKAMGLYAFVSAGGGSIGLLAGGALTQSLDWHWIFFVNVPIGIVAFLAGLALIEENAGIGLRGGVDSLGSVLITLATMLGAFAIVKSSDYGLLSLKTLLAAEGSLALSRGFLSWESRIANPIMPLRVLKQRMLMGSSLVRGLLVTGMFSAFFLGALYLEQVLGYDAIETGLAFMPLTIAIAIMSLGVSARLVDRIGAVRHAHARPRRDHHRARAARHAGRSTPATSPACSSPSWPSASGAGASFLPLLTIGMSDARQAGRGAGVGDHQRVGPAVRGDRAGHARHDRDRPRESPDAGRAQRGERADRRLPPGLHRGGRLRGRRDHRRACLPAPAAVAPAPGGGPRRDRHRVGVGRPDSHALALGGGPPQRLSSGSGGGCARASRRSE